MGVVASGCDALRGYKGRRSELARERIAQRFELDPRCWCSRAKLARARQLLGNCSATAPALPYYSTSVYLSCVALLQYIRVPILRCPTTVRPCTYPALPYYSTSVYLSCVALNLAIHGQLLTPSRLHPCSRVCSCRGVAEASPRSDPHDNRCPAISNVTLHCAFREQARSYRKPRSGLRRDGVRDQPASRTNGAGTAAATPAD